MQRADLIKRAKNLLGYPILNVYMTDDMFEIELDNVETQLASNYYIEHMMEVPMETCVQLDRRKVVRVVNVVPFQETGSTIQSVLYDEFTLAANLYQFSGVRESLSSVLLAKMYGDQVKTMFGNKFDWEFDKSSGKLYMSNFPAGTQTVMVDVISPISIENAPIEIEDWIKNYFIALVKIVEGNIRRKFKNLPGAPDDGDSLVSEGTAEKEKYEQELKDILPHILGQRY